MAGRIHVLWPDEIWDLWGEREAKKEGRWSIESARVAQFTTYQAAVDYLTSCELHPQEEPIGLSWTLLMSQIAGRATPPRKPFAKDSLLADWERAFIAKAVVLPVDPTYDIKEDTHE
jgi:hypothetical protein